MIEDEDPGVKVVGVSLDNRKTRTNEIDTEGDASLIFVDAPRPITVPDDGIMDLFLFHIHEENSQLFLFCKYQVGEGYITICLQVLEPRYYLYFLPLPGKRNELVDEVKSIAEQIGGKMFKTSPNPYVLKKYAFGDGIPQCDEWLSVSFSSKCRIPEIELQGKNYYYVNGISSSLTENFITNLQIKGPRWVKICKIQQTNVSLSTCPMITVKNPKRIVAVDRATIPNFNVCTFAMKTTINPKFEESRIMMISANILTNYNIETFSCTKSIQTFVQSSFDIDDNNVILCQTESDIIIKFLKLLESSDIDFISSYDLVSHDLRLLYARIEALEICGWWQLGRIRRGMITPNKEVSPIYYLAGRIPCDIQNSCKEFVKSIAYDFTTIVKNEFNEFRQNSDQIDITKELLNASCMFNVIEYNKRDTVYLQMLIQKLLLLPLTYQISQLSGCSWSRVLRGLPSHRCESLFIFSFNERNFLIPELNDENVVLKGEVQYAGGYVQEPKVGFYEKCIMLLDFNSLYPSIIREYNLCFTTVSHADFINLGDDPDSAREKIAIKAKHSQVKGILPEIMSSLLDARKEVKDKLSTATGVEIQRLQIKQKAYKILANASYGYLAYPLSRFPSIDIASLITNMGRVILKKTINQLSSLSYQIVYGDTDSVMILTSTEDANEAKMLASFVTEEINKQYKYIHLGVEEIFLKSLFLTKKKYAALLSRHPVNIDIKGMEVIRREWCNAMKKIYMFILEQYMLNDDKAEIKKSILNELSRMAHVLRNNGMNDDNELEITTNDLVINKTISQSPESYTRNYVHVAVAKWMQENGIPILADKNIPHIMVDNKAKDYSMKAKYKLNVYEVCEADIEWYISNQIFSPIKKLCETFGGPSESEISKALEVKTGKAAVKKQPEDFYLAHLKFNCPNCKKDYPSKITSLRCANCKNIANWKKIANSLTHFIHDKILEWGGSYYDQKTFNPVIKFTGLKVFKTLKYYISLYEGNPSDEAVIKLYNYMNDYILSIMNVHRLNQVRFTQLFKVDPLEWKE